MIEEIQVMMKKYLGKENYELFGPKERFQFDGFDLYISNDSGVTYFWLEFPCTKERYSQTSEATFIVTNFNKVKEAFKHVRNIAENRRAKREAYKENIELIQKMVKDYD